MSDDKQPAAHTPGPWTVTPKYIDEYGEALMQIECESHMIGEIYACDGAEGEANARLIAAAPDMYRIIKRFAEIDWIGEAELNFWINECRVIVRKVE